MLMEVLHRNKYSVEKARAELKNSFATGLPPEVTQFDDEETEAFALAVFAKSKDFNAISKESGKSVDACLRHYYTKFKKGRGYPRLKREMRKHKEEENDCAICEEGGDLICCDSCSSVFHPLCLSPPLLEVPEGDWFCPDCDRPKNLFEYEKPADTDGEKDGDETKKEEQNKHDESNANESTKRVDDDDGDKSDAAVKRADTDNFKSTKRVDDEDGDKGNAAGKPVDTEAGGEPDNFKSTKRVGDEDGDKSDAVRKPADTEVGGEPDNLTTKKVTVQAGVEPEFCVTTQVKPIDGQQ
jgi:uncharacterized Zn finger protein (UPF0148 family)